MNGVVVDEYENPIDIMSRKVFNSMKNHENYHFTVPDLKYLSRPIPSLSETNVLI
jgi:hypothetical protein